MIAYHTRNGTVTVGPSVTLPHSQWHCDPVGPSVTLSLSAWHRHYNDLLLL